MSRFLFINLNLRPGVGTSEAPPTQADVGGGVVVPKRSDDQIVGPNLKSGQKMGPFFFCGGGGVGSKYEKSMVIFRDSF